MLLGRHIGHLVQLLRVVVARSVGQLVGEEVGRFVLLLVIVEGGDHLLLGLDLDLRQLI